MGEINYKQIFARKKAYEEQILKVCPSAKHEAGIYIMTREENGFKFGYIGQSVDILSRLVSHMEGTQQHIDKSIKAHKLYSKDNPTGYMIHCKYCDQSKLDELEMHYTKLFANNGYQLRNKTSGSQGKGKFGINDNKEGKGYHDGLHKGYDNARKDVAKLFEKHLDCVYKGNKEPTKHQIKAMAKFQEFITIEKEDKNDEDTKTEN
ncbi:MAG: GIY-YIG nuclease family protein [Christensenellales bacterium]